MYEQVLGSYKVQGEVKKKKRQIYKKKSQPTNESTNQAATQPTNTLTKSHVGSMASLTAKHNGDRMNTGHASHVSDDITNKGHITHVVASKGKHEPSILHLLANINTGHTPAGY